MKTRTRLFLIVTGSAFLVCILVCILSIGHLIRQDRLDRALILAVKKLDAPAVDRLLAEGANANSKVKDEPPLTFVRLIQRMAARLQGKPAAALAKSSDTSLHLLMIDERVMNSSNAPKFDAIESALIRHGANIHVHGMMGEAPQSCAALWGLHQTLDLLVSRGADVNATDDDGRTPLMRADTYSTNVLLQHGASVDSTDSLKRTAIFYTENINTLKLLIDHGANVNAVDPEGLSLLYNMQGQWHSKRAASLRLLMQHGAHLNNKDRRVLAASKANRHPERNSL